MRVLDVTAFWAGPSATQYLATLGADVIKVESVQRPDSMRFNVSVSPKTERWWEQGYLFLSANLNKRGITLNLGDDRGRELFLQLVAQSDVVVENFTPRVMENFKLTYDAIREVRPDVVMVSMPGWGLDGPWRDRPGFATTMEQASGMAFVTGYNDGPPMAPGLCDPLAGVHGAFAVLAALEERRKTGRGQHIEVPMIDLAVNVSAEQILEFEVYGELMTRTGNRCLQAAPQGVYSCAGADEWLALSVTTEEQWKALCEAIGAPSWADDPELATIDHDRRRTIGSTRRSRPGARITRSSLPSTRSELPWRSRSSPPTPSTRTTRCRTVAFGNRLVTPWSVSTDIPDGRCASRAARGVGTGRRRRCSGSTTRRCSPISSASKPRRSSDLRQAGVIGERPLGL